MYMYKCTIPYALRIQCICNSGESGVISTQASATYMSIRHGILLFTIGSSLSHPHKEALSVIGNEDVLRVQRAAGQSSLTYKGKLELSTLITQTEQRWCEAFIFLLMKTKLQ